MSPLESGWSQPSEAAATAPATKEVNDPDTLAEVTAAFTRYERALVTNDVAVLDELFWDSPHTLRFGVGENLYGHREIAAFRAARPAAGLARSLTRTVITTFGRDFATASTEFRREGVERVGRQTQSWVRTPDGWRVVAAVNCSARVNSSLAGRPVRSTASATTSSTSISCLPPKPPPTRPQNTRTRPSGRPRTRASARRVRNGTWVEVRTTRRPSASVQAMAQCVSRWACCTRCVR